MTNASSTPQTTLIRTYRLLCSARLEAFPGCRPGRQRGRKLPRLQRMADVAMASAARLAGDPYASIMVSGDEIA